MKTPALVIMAAGLGSRFGGLKQLEPMGPNGEIIIDYSVFDALRAGFGKIVFVIKKEHEEAFREKIGKKVERHADVEYVFQQPGTLPHAAAKYAGVERTKPWGTGHAVYCCKDAVDSPFAVINADDFYGRESFSAVAGFLSNVKSSAALEFCMAGFLIENTLTENGSVSRGICTVGADGGLKSIEEKTQISLSGGQIVYSEEGESVAVSKGTVVSMNMWGFTPALFEELDMRFTAFLQKNESNLTKAEFFLPFVIDELIKEGKATVKVLEVMSKWYGVTYKEDKQGVIASIAEMIKTGIYPENLWS